jgi:hypothetical protein
LIDSPKYFAPEKARTTCPLNIDGRTTNPSSMSSWPTTLIRPDSFRLMKFLSPPAGLVLSSGTGTIMTVSGALTGSGCYNFTVNLTDNTTPVPQAATQIYGGASRLLASRLTVPGPGPSGYGLICNAHTLLGYLYSFARPPTVRQRLTVHQLRYAALPKPHNAPDQPSFALAGSRCRSFCHTARRCTPCFLASPRNRLVAACPRRADDVAQTLHGL